MSDQILKSEKLQPGAEPQKLRKRRWWVFGLAGALMGSILPPVVLICVCQVTGDAGGPMFLPIACIALFFIGGILGLLIGTIAWAIFRIKQKRNV
jgi:hypothetical protein